MSYGPLIVLAVAVAGAAWWLAPRIRRFFQDVVAERAHELFLLQEEWLEARFVALTRSMLANGEEEIVDSEFDPPALFARDRTTGQLVAFLDVTVRFGSEPTAAPDAPVPGSSRQGTAVFHYRHGQWGTNGRILFDMTALDALVHFAHDYDEIHFPPHAPPATSREQID